MAIITTIAGKEFALFKVKGDAKHLPSLANLPTTPDYDKFAVPTKLVQEATFATEDSVWIETSELNRVGHGQTTHVWQYITKMHTRDVDGISADVLNQLVASQTPRPGATLSFKACGMTPEEVQQQHVSKITIDPSWLVKVVNKETFVCVEDEHYFVDECTQCCAGATIASKHVYWLNINVLPDPSVLERKASDAHIYVSTDDKPVVGYSVALEECEAVSF